MSLRETGRSVWWGHICFLCKFSFWWWTNTSVGSWGNSNMVSEQRFLNPGFQATCIRITWVRVRWNFWVPFQICWARNSDGIQEYAFYQLSRKYLWVTRWEREGQQSVTSIQEPQKFKSSERGKSVWSVRSKLILKRKASARRVGKWKRGRVRTGWGRQGPALPPDLQDIAGTISVEERRQMEDNLED